MENTRSGLNQSNSGNVSPANVDNEPGLQRVNSDSALRRAANKVVNFFTGIGRAQSEVSDSDSSSGLEDEGLMHLDTSDSDNELAALDDEVVQLTSPEFSSKVENTAARTGTNPLTGETIELPASRVPNKVEEPKVEARASEQPNNNPNSNSALPAPSYWQRATDLVKNNLHPLRAAVVTFLAAKSGMIPARLVLNSVANTAAGFLAVAAFVMTKIFDFARDTLKRFSYKQYTKSANGVEGKQLLDDLSTEQLSAFLDGADAQESYKAQFASNANINDYKHPLAYYAGMEAKRAGNDDLLSDAKIRIEAQRSKPKML